MYVGGKTPHSIVAPGPRFVPAAAQQKPRWALTRRERQRTRWGGRGAGTQSGAEWPVLNYKLHLSSARPCLSRWCQHLPEHLKSRNLVLVTSLHDVWMGTLKTAVGYGHKASCSLKDQDVGPPSVQFSSSPSRVQLFATPCTAACQASLSIASSQSLLRLMSVDSHIGCDYDFVATYTTSYTWKLLLMAFPKSETRHSKRTLLSFPRERSISRTQPEASPVWKAP